MAILPHVQVSRLHLGERGTYLSQEGWEARLPETARKRGRKTHSGEVIGIPPVGRQKKRRLEVMTDCGTKLTGKVLRVSRNDGSPTCQRCLKARWYR